MPGIVYLLCAATSLLCAILLLRAYLKNHVRLLLWSGLCFLGLMLENILLYADIIIFPDVDLSPWRRIPAIAAYAVLLFGLIWDSK